jgi:hypothetical protein
MQSKKDKEKLGEGKFSVRLFDLFEVRGEAKSQDMRIFSLGVTGLEGFEGPSECLSVHLFHPILPRGLYTSSKC